MPASAQMTDQELFDAINERVGEDRDKAKEFARAFRSACKPVAQSLINIGGSQKKGDIDALNSRVKQLEDEAEQKDAEIQELRAKTPDAQALTEKYEKKLAEARDAKKAAEESSRSLRKQVAKDKALALIKRRDGQGFTVDDLWADKVVAADIDDRIVVKDDGSIDVLELGQTTSYDGDTVDAKLAALARDARKAVPSQYLISNADAGAGIRGSNGGGAAGNTWTQFRKDVEKERKQQITGPTAAERLRGVTTTTVTAR